MTDLEQMEVMELDCYTDNLLWRHVLSPKCRNYSHDPGHAHVAILHMANSYTKFEVFSLSRSGEISQGVKF